MLTTKKKANLLDIVEVLEDLPKFGIRRGERGAVVEILDNPSEAYILEFVDERDGTSRLAYWVKPEQIVNTARETFERGIELFNTGRSAEALLEFRKAVKIQPNYVRVLHNSFVKSFEGSIDWQRGINAMRIVLRVDPGYQIARDNLAIAFMNYGFEKATSGGLKASTQLYHLALSVGPSREIVVDLHRNLAAAYTGLGMLAHEDNRLEDAVRYMGRACSFHPNPDTRRNQALACAFLAFWLMDQGRIAEAIEGFERAQDGGLTTPGLLNDYAVALVHNGRVQEASVALRLALELDPDNETLQQNLETVRLGSSTTVSIGETRVHTYPRAAEMPAFAPPPPMSDRSYIAA
jgi:tetratricopeptide (TPR) repeat protein